jgi:hypothetical protein
MIEPLSRQDSFDVNWKTKMCHKIRWKCLCFLLVVLFLGVTITLSICLAIGYNLFMIRFDSGTYNFYVSCYFENYHAFEFYIICPIVGFVTTIIIVTFTVTPIIFLIIVCGLTWKEKCSIRTKIETPNSDENDNKNTVVEIT